MCRPLHLTLVLVLVTAGCVTTTGPDTTPTETDAPEPTTPSTTAPTTPATPTAPATPTTPVIPTTSATPVRTPPPASTLALASNGVACEDDLWVSFWGRERPAGAWERDLVRVGYDVPSNGSVLVVAYVDGAPASVTFEGAEDGAHVDGAKLRLNDTLTGDHVVEVVMYEDTNGNGRFDQGIDAPCLSEGAPVTTGPTWVNFSRFE